MDRLEIRDSDCSVFFVPSVSPFDLLPFVSLASTIVEPDIVDGVEEIRLLARVGDSTSSNRGSEMVMILILRRNLSPSEYTESVEDG